MILTIVSGNQYICCDKDCNNIAHYANCSSIPLRCYNHLQPGDTNVVWGQCKICKITYPLNVLNDDDECELCYLTCDEDVPDMTDTTDMSDDEKKYYLSFKPEKELSEYKLADELISYLKEYKNSQNTLSSKNVKLINDIIEFIEEYKQVYPNGTLPNNIVTEIVNYLEECKSSMPFSPLPEISMVSTINDI